MTENPLSSTSKAAGTTEPCLQQVAQRYQDKRKYSNSTALSFRLMLIFLSSSLFHSSTVCLAHGSSLLPDTSHQAHKLFELSSYCQHNYSQGLSKGCCIQFHMLIALDSLQLHPLFCPLSNPCLSYLLFRKGYFSHIWNLTYYS